LKREGIFAMACCRSVVGAIVVIWSSILAPRVLAQDRPQPLNPLESLQHHTGWVPLGALTPDRKSWAAGGDPLASQPTATYEFVDRRALPDRPVLPKRGDRIRFKVRLQIVITDSKTSGERGRGTPPMSRRPVESADGTGLWLDPGQIVRVGSVYVSPVVGHLRFVWAQVTP
jgi:hypothetical protein